MSTVAFWDAMGLAARVIVLLLAGFAILFVAIVVERFLALFRAGTVSLPQLHRRLRILASIKSTAPMLGLLGTLLGSINLLAGIAMTGAVDQRAVGAGLAEALTLTVIGLLIGLPAWWAHSLYSAWADRVAVRGSAPSR